MTAETRRVFQEAAAVAPQPVAMAAGVVLRARSPEQELDAALRCAEVLARYLAAVALASFAARADDQGGATSPPPFEGNLAFGHFLSVVQWAAGVAVHHSLKADFAAGFGKRRRGGRGKADECFVALLNLRNRIGHQLDSLTEARVKSILAKEEPLERLAAAMRSLDRILALPLLVVEVQSLEEGSVVARLLLLMGENADPYPEDVPLEPSTSFRKTGSPYLGTREGALRLDPMMVWDVAEETQNYRLYLLDAVEHARLRYKALGTSPRERDGEAAARLRRLLGGERAPLETVRPARKRSFVELWSERRARQLQRLSDNRGPIPWEAMCTETLTWFAAKVRPGEEMVDPRKIVMEHLLDGREEVDEKERAQLILLFGTESEVHRRLGRPTLDLRVVRTKGVRWDQRVECRRNVFHALRTAVRFFLENMQLEGVASEELSAPEGTPDYVALREALVNILIHQDYDDRSAAAQIELRRHEAIFFNPGCSLVEQTALADGGKSVCRNPHLARALRLVGFAELAGSGLRVLQEAWRSVRRRPPRIESDRQANTFSLTLDWRQIPEDYDRHWREHLGVKISSQEATILALAADPAGVNAQEAAAAVGSSVAEAAQMLEHLRQQVLLKNRGTRYYLRDDLRSVVREGR